MNPPEESAASCAFIPVYCYYDRENGREIKTPVLIMDSETFYLTALILDIDSSLFKAEELKDQFIEAYHKMTGSSENNDTLDTYDIFPQLISILHTDNEEISIFVCELYENSELYFKKQNHSQVQEYVSYKEGIDELINDGALEPLTEKILVNLSEEKYLTSNRDDSQSIELF